MIKAKGLRLTIGWLGIFLPLLVVIILLRVPSSISETYYTRAGTVFTGILTAAGLLLINYKGYDLKDDILNTMAGIFGVIICVFPCYADNVEVTGVFNTPIGISSFIHNTSAFIFFGILAYNSFFQFTKSSGKMSDKKKKRNIIFRVCGIGMILSFAIMLLPNFYCKTWLAETLALLFFGVSWLTKANAYMWLFADDMFDIDVLKVE